MNLFSQFLIGLLQLRCLDHLDFLHSLHVGVEVLLDYDLHLFFAQVQFEGYSLYFLGQPDHVLLDGLDGQVWGLSVRDCSVVSVAYFDAKLLVSGDQVRVRHLGLHELGVLVVASNRYAGICK